MEDKNPNLYKYHSITRMPCSHCSHLCSPKAKACPKCGEPLTPLKNTADLDYNYNMISERTSHEFYIKSIENNINHQIPKLRKVNKGIRGYKKAEDQILTLSLFKCRLTEIPPEVYQLSSLKKLFLRRNSLEIISKEIMFLENLEILNASINKLEHISPSIGSLTNLKYLDLSSNNLKAIPETVGNLKSLEYLNLSNNKLLNIPESFAGLSSLRYLNLKANFWIEIPSSVHDLRAKGLEIYQ
ncbi:MAG: hypothetical protein GF383_03750 [Candidatus Lokiarchaeota archaeon]|nr:hypothetical protein [Candidatus Lokiarchaeota archaeon]MBD3338809.1 hypothetical protein [Candidatus Lokiarchaeota archaeon]